MFEMIWAGVRAAWTTLEPTARAATASLVMENCILMVFGLFGF